MPKIAILAGEASGDLIGSHLMSYLNSKIKNIEFIGVGGPEMSKNGLISYFDYKEISVHGYFDALKKIFRLLSLRSNLVDYLLKERPDIFIGIDAPDFNFGVERRLKFNNIPTFHYVAPSVWAWRQGRVFEIKENVDHLFAVFPHEPKIFQKAKVPITFVGHPLASKIPLNPNINKGREKLNLDKGKTIITLLPGSRLSEIKYHFELMINTAILINKELTWRKLKQAEFLIPINSKENYDHMASMLNLYSNKIKSINLLIGHSHDAICSSNMVIAVSGTATLEAALYKKPMVIVYKTSLLSYFLLKKMLLIPYVGLPNILLKKFIVPEFLQNSATPENISDKAIEILTDKKFQKYLKVKFKDLHTKLKRNSSELIYKKIIKYLK
ncbi:lipid-A-disaccharide synthase [Methylophilaceae bacterium]|jgi:lipid-A-disaccharide synthase|nr:lipid-A-disaccharide synthase [Methylophilaceae bacterium]